MLATDRSSSTVLPIPVLRRVAGGAARLLACVLLLACGASSCIAVPSRSDEDAARNPRPEKSTASLRVDVQSEGDSDLWELSDDDAARAVADSLLQTGWFSEVRESSPSDVAFAVDVRLIPSEHEWGVLFLLGFTFGTLPVWLTQELEMSVEATLPSSAPRRYAYRGRAVEVGWLPLIVAAPFLTPSSAVRAVIEDGVDDVVRQMVADGSLPALASARETPAITSAP